MMERVETRDWNTETYSLRNLYLRSDRLERKADAGTQRTTANHMISGLSTIPATIPPSKIAQPAKESWLCLHDGCHYSASFRLL